jgi:hypothetical protein
MQGWCPADTIAPIYIQNKLSVIFSDFHSFFQNQKNQSIDKKITNLKLFSEMASSSSSSTPMYSPIAQGTAADPETADSDKLHLLPVSSFFRLKISFLRDI